MSSVSVTTWGAPESAEHPVTFGGQEVIVTVRELKIGDTETEMTGIPFGGEGTFSVTTNVVVDAACSSVVRCAVGSPSATGQTVVDT